MSMDLLDLINRRLNWIIWMTAINIAMTAAIFVVL